MGNVVRVKGIPPIKLKPHRPLPPPESLKTILITRKGQRVMVNLGYAVEREPLPPSDAAVGIVLGVTDRMILSTGEAIARREIGWHPIAENQRRLSRCKKGSREWRKRVRVLANARDRQRVSNRNECHRITTAIVRRYGPIAIENLAIPNIWPYPTW